MIMMIIFKVVMMILLLTLLKLIIDFFDGTIECLPGVILVIATAAFVLLQ